MKCHKKVESEKKGNPFITPYKDKRLCVGLSRIVCGMQKIRSFDCTPCTIYVTQPIKSDPIKKEQKELLQYMAELRQSPHLKIQTFTLSHQTHILETSHI